MPGASATFSQGFAGRLVPEHRFRQQLRQPGVLRLQLPKRLAAGTLIPPITATPASPSPRKPMICGVLGSSRGTLVLVVHVALGFPSAARWPASPSAALLRTETRVPPTS
jgi:hypothetical protein